ncbi:HOS4 (YIL112W) [Zygosaccharomyces parabailii]|nr:HOS4 (YIL112W) [Zygosaccharomyces parabailii]
MSDPNETKKRSLSSYLSNVNTRREELEKLKQHQHQRQDHEHQDHEHQDHEHQDHEHQDHEHQEHEYQEHEHQEHEHQEHEHEQHEHEQQVLLKNQSKKHSELQTELQDHKEDEQHDRQHLDQQHLDQHLDQRQHRDQQQRKEYSKGTITRLELHSILKGPDVSFPKPPNDPSSDEVDSDAPTEPASPPKPRRGRLIRGDRLSSQSPRQVSFDNDSDSDLSDIDELNKVNISSSVLHGDSSPAKHLPSSRRSSKPSKQHKRGIYRDAGGRTRLQIACDKGNYETARRLIEEEAYDVNDQDNAGNTALHEAALNGHLEIVQLLIDHGADVNVQSYEMFKDTPLIDASANGHLRVVQLLLEHGADPLVCNAKGFTAYDSIDEDADLDDNERHIVQQIQECLRAATKKSLDRAAGSKDPSPGQTRRSEDDYEFYWTDISSRAGREKLLRASKEGKLAYVGAYLENGGRVDVKSFFEAVKFGHEDITSLFLAFGAQVNVSLKDGTTALMAAVGRGHRGTVKLLLDADADPSRRDKAGHTALYYAKNSPMGIVDADEVQLVRKSVERFGGIENDPREKQETPEMEDRQSTPEAQETPESHNTPGTQDKRKREESPDRDVKRQTVEPEVERETPAEREARLKAEEEYFQRRLQNKKKREQELLRKLELDEQKREEEKEKQRLEELRRLEEQQKQHQLELEESQRQEQLAHRREIRSQYPLGLKLVDFNNKEDYHSYLPLFYVVFDGSEHVLDLQACVLLKDTSVLGQSNPVDQLHKEQLWNILKFIFLMGGVDRHLVDFSSSDLQTRIHYEQQEFGKFANLPMHWIPWDAISGKLEEKKRVAIHSSMQEIVLTNPNVTTTPNSSRSSSTPSSFSNSLPALDLPKFQQRSQISFLLQSHNTGPLW